MRKTDRETLDPEKVKQIDAYNNEYTRKNKDRFYLVMPKGKKGYYNQYAEEQGLSLTQFILMAVDSWIEQHDSTEVYKIK